MTERKVFSAGQGFWEADVEVHHPYQSAWRARVDICNVTFGKDHRT